MPLLLGLVLSLQGCVRMHEPLRGLNQPVVLDPREPNFSGTRLTVVCNPTPTLEPAEAPTHSWLGDFHLQVAARSPRLAACFRGVAESDALQWSAGVESLSGTVVEGTVTPLSETAPLTWAEQDCVQDVFATPAYTLSAGPDPEGRSLPTRVRLLLEF